MTFVGICKQKAVGGFRPESYIAAVMYCLLWTFCGLPIVHPDSTLFVTFNGIGLVLDVIYLIIFLIYGRKVQRKKIVICLVVEIIFMAAVVSATLFGFHTHQGRSAVVDDICIIISGFTMYVANLVVTRSVKYMPFLLALTSFLNALCWFCYAFIKFNLFIMLANGLGAIFGFAQLVLYGIYFRATPVEKVKKNKSPDLSEVIISC